MKSVRLLWIIFRLVFLYYQYNRPHIIASINRYLLIDPQVYLCTQLVGSSSIRSLSLGHQCFWSFPPCLPYYLNSFPLLTLFCLLLLISWWNLPHLSLCNYIKMLLDLNWVVSKMFFIEGRIENLLPFLMSFLSFDSVIFELINSLNLSWINELTIANRLNSLLTDVTYPFAGWVLISLIFWHVYTNGSMLSCKWKYFMNSQAFNVGNFNNF